MNNFHGIAFTLPDGWAEKLKAQKVAPRRPTSAFLLSLLKALGITQAELSGELDVDPLMVSRWTRGICEPQGMSEAEKTLDDWARQISVIQHVSSVLKVNTPEQWDSMVPVLRAFRRSRRGPSL